MSWKNSFTDDELSRIEFCQLIVERGTTATPNEQLIAKLADLLNGKPAHDRMLAEDLKLGKQVLSAYQAIVNDFGTDCVVTVGMIAAVLKGIEPRKVGYILRRVLGMQIGERRGYGYPVIWDAAKMQELRERFGL